MLIEGPVDKLDVRIPRGTKLVNDLARALRTSGHSNPLTNCFDTSIPGSAIREARHYIQSHDLRLFGLSSILFFGNKCSGNHKLKIVGTGTMSLSRIVSEIKSAFEPEFDPMQAEIMRIDLAVDVIDYSIEWFRQNVRIARKRHTSQFDHWVSERKRVETLYFGQRPNLVRIYDKSAERRVEYERIKSKWDASRLLPTFEEQYGRREDEVLTRVERQYGGGKVPSAICTLAKLRENAAGFNPYEPLRFLPITISEESVNQLSGDAYLRGQGVLRLLERYGYHHAKRVLDKQSCRNTHRLLAQLRSSPASDRNSKPPDLFAIYTDSINQQLSG